MIEAAADRGLGQLAAVVGRPDEAEERYLAALELERRIGAPALAARTLYWYARLLSERGDRRAAELAVEAVAEASALGMELLAHQAGEFLRP